MANFQSMRVVPLAGVATTPSPTILANRALNLDPFSNLSRLKLTSYQRAYETIRKVLGMSSQSVDATKLKNFKAMLADPRVAKAAGYTPTDVDPVVSAFVELETGNVVNWDELSPLSVVNFTAVQARQVWARRLALSLFHEIHHTFPWSIFDLSEFQLRLTLGYFSGMANADGSLVTDAVTGMIDFVQQGSLCRMEQVWATNPLRTLTVVLNVLYQERPKTRQEALVGLIRFMQVNGWTHPHFVDPTDFLGIVNGYDTSKYAHLPGSGINVNDYLVFFGGNCGGTSRFLREVMRGFGVPVQVCAIGKMGHEGARVSIPEGSSIIAHGDFVSMGKIMPPECILTDGMASYLYEGLDLLDALAFYEFHCLRDIIVRWTTYWNQPAWSPALRELYQKWAASGGVYLDEAFLSSDSTYKLSNDADVVAAMKALGANLGFPFAASKFLRR